MLAAYLDLRGDLMARFDTHGFDGPINDINSMDLSDEETDEILMAGAEQVKQAWKFAARMHKLKDTGDMIDSIDYAKQPKQAAGVKYVDIYPQGKDRKGVRNATKAFILHHGSTKFRATHWVDDADALCEGEFSVHGAMLDKFNEILERKRR
jgi:hypothetical protein